MDKFLSEFMYKIELNRENLVKMNEIIFFLMEHE